MMRSIDTFLNSTTMYRLVLYGLTTLAVISILFAFGGFISYSGILLMISFFLVTGGCFVFNYFFAYFFRAPSNPESALITGLILFFIFSPAASMIEAVWLLLAAVLAMASKYLLAIHKRHIFNPAAFAAVVVGVMGNGMAVWWVGSEVLLIPMLIVGFAIVRKTRRFALVGSFVSLFTLMSVLASFHSHVAFFPAFLDSLVSWPIFFFATTMLTEPQTTPPTHYTRIGYGALIGVLFWIPFQFGPLYSTPEIALLLGNIFSFVLSQKRTFTMRLLEKNQLTPGLVEFVFEPNYRFSFLPGQYLEWTLAHPNPDNRGIRRFFTLASSPEESAVRLGVRFGDRVSSFKQALQSQAIGSTVLAGHLSGDFVLPKDPGKKIVFIAGGIGITPFRSMVQFLIDTKQRRDIVLLYACASSDDFAYGEIFQKARELFGLKTVQIVTDATRCAPSFNCRIGYIDEQLLSEEVSDFHERICYLSGPVTMVTAYKKLLLLLSVPQRNIKTDYFPGF